MTYLLMQVKSTLTEWKVSLNKGMVPVAVGKGPTLKDALLDLAQQPYIDKKEVESCRR